MSAAVVVRFPPRRSQVVWLLPERLGGWVVVLREFGWLYGSRAEAVREATQLARSHGLRVLAEGR